jgi:PPK2 family polyphosphate:nucleotide phosphotransferase
MKFSEKFRIEPKDQVKLSKFDPAWTTGLNKEIALKELEESTSKLWDQQLVLYAENKRSLLVILQGMDTSGKDGAIRHVMKGLNPQGCMVTSFKAPSTEELDHDFLWRIHKAVPAKGDIGIFNRSHYEDVLIVRVHELVSKKVWKNRFDQINEFENMLTKNGVTIIKCFLHISKDEQKKRLQARLDDPKKTWKFDPHDLEERKLWDKYVDAYEDVLSKCSTKYAPWFIIPSDVKWFRNLVISEIMNETLQKMDLQFPKPAKGIQKLKIV